MARPAARWSAARRASSSARSSPSAADDLGAQQGRAARPPAPSVPVPGGGQQRQQGLRGPQVPRLLGEQRAQGGGGLVGAAQGEGQLRQLAAGVALGLAGEAGPQRRSADPPAPRERPPSGAAPPAPAGRRGPPEPGAQYCASRRRAESVRPERTAAVAALRVSESSSCSRGLSGSVGRQGQHGLEVLQGAARIRGQAQLAPAHAGGGEGGVALQRLGEEGLLAAWCPRPGARRGRAAWRPARMSASRAALRAYSFAASSFSPRSSSSSASRSSTSAAMGP